MHWGELEILELMEVEPEVGEYSLYYVYRRVEDDLLLSLTVFPYEGAIVFSISRDGSSIVSAVVKDCSELRVSEEHGRRVLVFYTDDPNPSSLSEEPIKRKLGYIGVLPLRTHFVREWHEF